MVRRELIAEGLGKVVDVDNAFGLSGGSLRGRPLKIADGALGIEDGLGDVAEDARFLSGDAAVKKSIEDFAHDEVDLSGRGEVSGELGDFRGERFVEWSVGRAVRCRGFAGVGGTEIGMFGRDGLATAASAGEIVEAPGLV